jgi:hypothetical protein
MFLKLYDPETGERRERGHAAFDALRDRLVLIRSFEHGAYWRAGGSGYATEEAAAGRHSFDDAYDRTWKCGPEKRIAYELAPTSWRPIETAPRSGFGEPNRYVLVRGPSGMVGVEHDVILAYHNAEYRPLDPWRDVHGDALADRGLAPTEWMEVPE